MRTSFSLSRRRVLIAGGVGAAAGLAAATVGRIGVAGTAAEIVSLGCCAADGVEPDAVGRVLAASRGAGALPSVRGRSHVVSVVGFHPAHGRRADATPTRDFGDFGHSALRLHFARPYGTDVPVSIWSCTALDVPSVGGSASMEVPAVTGGVIPVSLELQRTLSPLARRLCGAAGEASAVETHTLEQAIELPRRAGFYFLGGRRAGFGALPSWDRCQVRLDAATGAPTLEMTGLGEPRPVDFPYLVLRVEDSHAPTTA